MTDSAAPTPPPLKKKNRKRPWWLWIVVVVVLLGIGGGLSMRKQEKVAKIVTEKAIRTDLTQSVSATGKLRPVTEVKISPEVAGEVIELPVVEGQEVKKGDLLARIKPDTYKAQLEQQEAALSAAKAESLQRKSQLLKDEQDLRRATDLHDKGLISEQDMITATTAREVSQSAYDASLYAIEGATGSLNQAKEQLSKTNIFAPMDGTISTLPTELGERVVGTGQFAGTEMMRIANMADMEVRVDVNENDVVSVKVGQVAKISIDAYPNRTFLGRVQHIANTAAVKSEGTQEEVTNFEVRIRLEPADVPLRPGMSATADIATASVKDVIAVPIQSVTVRSREGAQSMEQLQKKRDEEMKNRGGQEEAEKADREKLQRVVFIKDGKVARLRPVETGIADNTNIEIKSGVQPGEEIVSGSYAAISKELKDGMKVEIEKPKDDAK